MQSPRNNYESMISPPIEGLLDRVDSKFRLVTLGARRSRQLTSYFNQLGDGLGNKIPPQVSTVARKPLSMAFEEIAADKIVAAPVPEPIEDDLEDASGVETLDGSVVD